MNNLAVLSLLVFLMTTITSCKTEQNDTNSTTTQTNQIDSSIRDHNKSYNTNLTEIRFAGEYKYSLAQWSLNKQLFDGSLDNLDFAKLADSLGFEGVEYVNQFFKDKAEDFIYLQKMKDAAAQAEIESILIMIDGEGDLADTSNLKRELAVKNHFKWVNAAQFLGCHSIRVNLFGTGSKLELRTAAIKSLNDLSTYAISKNINVLVENHGGYSSDGKWLSAVIVEVNMDNCGTLPDFGNFCLRRAGGKQWGAPCIEAYPKYKGIEELMPFAKGVSAKSFDFDKAGEEVTIDYRQMMDIVRSSGYNGYIGVEYEGEDRSAVEGILATKRLLKRY